MTDSASSWLERGLALPDAESHNGSRPRKWFKEAAAEYLDAQVELIVVARQARDAGVAVTELPTSWLDTPAGEAVIEAWVEAEQDAARSEQVNDEVNTIMDALCSNGYKPTLRIEDVEVDGGPVPE